MEDLHKYEHELNEKGINIIAGVDEVGRGPLVGNVTAACVVLPLNYKLSGLTDSKKLSEIDTGEIYDQCILFSVIRINGGSDSNSLKYKK